MFPNLFTSSWPLWSTQSTPSLAGSETNRNDDDTDASQSAPDASEEEQPASTHQPNEQFQGATSAFGQHVPQEDTSPEAIVQYIFPNSTAATTFGQPSSSMSLTSFGQASPFSTTTSTFGQSQTGHRSSLFLPSTFESQSPSTRAISDEFAGPNPFQGIYGTPIGIHIREPLKPPDPASLPPVIKMEMVEKDDDDKGGGDLFSSLTAHFYKINFPEIYDKCNDEWRWEYYCATRRDSNIFGNTSQQPAGEGMFGQQNTAGFGFGAPTTRQPSFLGQTQAVAQQTALPFQPSSSATLFGTGSTSNFEAYPQPTGTTIKLQPLLGTDVVQKHGVTYNVNTKHHCITCMKEYEGKSLEELRWEDYQANCKCGPQQTGFDDTPFSSVFGQQQEIEPVYEQVTGEFGMDSQIQSQSAEFVNRYDVDTNPMGSSPFDAASARPIFEIGTQQTPIFEGGMPSQQENTFCFGIPQTDSATNVDPQNFEVLAKQSDMFIGSQSSTTSLGFEQGTADSIFEQQQLGFGQMDEPANNATGFGQAGQATFDTAPALGIQQETPFGGSWFRQSADPTNYFSSNTMQPQLAPQQQPLSLLLPSERHNDDYKTALNISDQFGQLIQLASIKSEDDYSEHSQTTKSDDLERLVDQSLTQSMGPIKIGALPVTMLKTSIFAGLAVETAGSSGSLPKPRRRLLLKDKDFEATPTFVASDEEPISNTPVIELLYPESSFAKRRVDCAVISEPDPERPVRKTVDYIKASESSTSQSTVGSKASWFLTKEDLDCTTSYSDSGSVSIVTSRKTSQSTLQTSSVTLKRPQYYSIPSVEELENMRGEDGKCLVHGFTVGRIGYGNVCFLEIIDVSNLNLDEIVHIRHREIIVYPDNAEKPPKGEGLNRRAQVTLDNVYPRVQGNLVKDADDSLVLCFTETLREVCERKKMRFLEYRPETGSLVFEVDHFSQYGLDSQDVNVDGQKCSNTNRNGYCDISFKFDMGSHINKTISEENGFDQEENVVSCCGFGEMPIPAIKTTNLAIPTINDNELNIDRGLGTPLYSLSNFYSGQISVRTKEVFMQKPFYFAMQFDLIAVKVVKPSAYSTDSLPLMSKNLLVLQLPKSSLCQKYLSSELCFLQNVKLLLEFAPFRHNYIIIIISYDIYELIASFKENKVEQS